MNAKKPRALIVVFDTLKIPAATSKMKIIAPASNIMRNGSLSPAKRINKMLHIIL